MELFKLFNKKLGLRISYSFKKTHDDDKKNLPEVFFSIGKCSPAFTF